MRTLAGYILTLPAGYISESFIKIKIYLNYYFHTSLWCLKRFYEGLFSFRLGLGREGLKPKLADASFSDTQLPWSIFVANFRKTLNHIVNSSYFRQIWKLFYWDYNILLFYLKLGKKSFERESHKNAHKIWLKPIAKWSQILFI